MRIDANRVDFVRIHQFDGTRLINSEVEKHRSAVEDAIRSVFFEAFLHVRHSRRISVERTHVLMKPVSLNNFMIFYDLFS